MHLRIPHLTFLCLLAIPVALGVVFGFAQKTYAADNVTAAYYVDGDDDGTVDHAVFIFDELIDQCNFEAGDWSIGVAGTIGVTAITAINTTGVEGPGMGACDGSDDRVYVTITTTANITGGAVDPEITYTNQGTLGSLSGVTTAQISNQSAELGDWVAPVVVSTNPASGAAGHSRSRDIVITFSEAMATTFNEGTQFSISPDPGGFTAVWSAGNTVLTLNGPNFACSISYTITTDEGEIDAVTGGVVALNVDGPHSGEWSFRSSGCSSPTEDTVAASSVTLASPGEGASLIPGSMQEITWNSDSGSSFVTLSYSENGGESYTYIAQNIPNESHYIWAVPEGISGDVVIKVEITDLVIVLASDTSSALSVVQESIETVTEDGGSAEEAEGASEEDAEDAQVDGVLVNSYLVGTSFNAVYYVDSNFVRHPFMNEQTFFTWQTDFSNVYTVSDTTLALLPMGAPMLPKPGTSLIKIQSDANVYAVEENEDDEFSPGLRRINSEATAAMLFGSAWASQVMDVDVTLFGRYTRGSDITN